MLAKANSGMVREEKNLSEKKEEKQEASAGNAAL